MSPIVLPSLTPPPSTPVSTLFVSADQLRPSLDAYVNKNGEYRDNILLLDELASVIHGFIPANRANHYRNDLKGGSIVRLERFEVARVAKRSQSISSTQEATVLAEAQTVVRRNSQVVLKNSRERSFCFRSVSHLSTSHPTTVPSLKM